MSCLDTSVVARRAGLRCDGLLEDGKDRAKKWPASRDRPQHDYIPRLIHFTTITVILSALYRSWNAACANNQHLAVVNNSGAADNGWGSWSRALEMG